MNSHFAGHIAEAIEQQKTYQRLLDVPSPAVKIAESLQATLETFRRNPLTDVAEHDNSSLKLLAQASLQESEPFAALSKSMAGSLFSSIRVQDLFGASSFLAGYAREQEDFQTRLRRIAFPWIELEETLRSITSVAKLSALGNALELASPFGRSMTEVLGETLGRWGASLKFSPDLLNPMARVDAYRSRGFDCALTDFPSADFGDVLSVVDISLDFALPSPALIPAVRQRKAPATDADALLVAPEENRRAYRLIFSLERHLREYINKRMGERYGPDWYKHRLDSKILKRWQRGAERAQAKGRPIEALIEYSTLRDYEGIIGEEEHWEEVFRVSFGRRESVLESFYRLGPVRHSTMHCRVLTREEYLTLWVEARLLLRACGQPFGNSPSG